MQKQMLLCLSLMWTLIFHSYKTAANLHLQKQTAEDIFFIFIYLSDWCWLELHLHSQPLHLLIVLSSSAALYVNLDAECTFMSLPALLETVPALQHLQNETFFQFFNVKATWCFLCLICYLAVWFVCTTYAVLLQFVIHQMCQSSLV